MKPTLDISSKICNTHKSRIRVKIIKGMDIPDLEKLINQWLEVNLGIEILNASLQSVTIGNKIYERVYISYKELPK